jgi:hypothetical protein
MAQLRCLLIKKHGVAGLTQRGQSTKLRTTLSPRSARGTVHQTFHAALNAQQRHKSPSSHENRSIAGGKPTDRFRVRPSLSPYPVNGHLTCTFLAALESMNARFPRRYSCSSSAVNQISASRTQLRAPHNIRPPESGIRLWTWG